LAGLGGLKPRPFRSGAPNRAARQVAAHNTTKPAAERAAVPELFGLIHSGTRAPK
jgi:hypothetical protein